MRKTGELGKQKQEGGEVKRGDSCMDAVQTDRNKMPLVGESMIEVSISVIFFNLLHCLYVGRQQAEVVDQHAVGECEAS